jgi:hypothetical protein
LTAKLPKSVVFRPFHWTGGNSFKARGSAADDLENYLIEGISAYPDANHAIIAHSHGGNIALVALNNPVLRQRINSLVCLSTPFISVAPSSLVSALEGISPIDNAVKMFGWVFLSLLVIVSLLSLLLEHSNRVSLILANLLWIVALYGVIRLSRSLTHNGSIRLLNSRRLLLAKFSVPSCDDINLLVIRPAGDEASSVLISFQFLHWIIAKIRHLIFHAAENTLEVRKSVENFGKRHPIIAAAVPIGCSVVYTVHMARIKEAPDEIGLCIFVGCLFAIVALILLKPFCDVVAIALVLGFTAASAVCLPFLTIALMVTVMPLGLSDVIGLSVMQVTIEASPPGAAFIVQLPPSDAPGLMHSTTYENQSAIYWTAKMGCGIW